MLKYLVNLSGYLLFTISKNISIIFILNENKTDRKYLKETIVHKTVKFCVGHNNGMEICLIKVNK